MPSGLGSAACHLIIAVTGGLDSPAYPLLYGLVAFATSVLARTGAVATVVVAILLEAALLFRSGLDSVAITRASIHVAVLIGAALAHLLLLRRQIIVTASARPESDE